MLNDFHSKNLKESLHGRTRRKNHFFILFVFQVVGSILFLFAAAAQVDAGCPVPLKMTKADNLPGMTDFSLSSLEQAVQASLTYYQRLPAERKFQVCGRILTAADQIRVLENFLAIARASRTPAEFWPRVTRQFDFCRPAGAEMLVTAYYEPVFNGSLHKSDKYSYPLYSLPSDLVVRRRDGKKRVGRQENGLFVPYWSRKEIERGNLLAGLELVYLSDPFEVFLLHIQGSGRIRLEDGATRLVRYAGNNGRKYTSIGKVLADRGRLALKEIDMKAIRRYLNRHPDEMEEILHANERFIFFTMSGPDEKTTAAPPGSIGQPLTPGYSIALDQHAIQPGHWPFWSPIIPSLMKRAK